MLEFRYIHFCKFQKITSNDHELTIFAIISLLTYMNIKFLLGSKRNSTKMGRPSLDSTEFKLQVVEEAKALNNNAQVARNHGISPASVRNWRKNEDKLSKIFLCVRSITYRITDEMMMPDH